MDMVSTSSNSVVKCRAKPRLEEGVSFPIRAGASIRETSLSHEEPNFTPFAQAKTPRLFLVDLVGE